MESTDSVGGSNASKSTVFCRLLLMIVSLTASRVIAADRNAETARLQLQGNRAFDSASIHRSLENDVVIRRLTNLRITGQPMAEEVAGRIIAGYRSHGYLDATATAAINGADAVFTISEGPSYRRGSVRVVGIEAAMAEQLQAMLVNTSREFRTPILAKDNSISKEFLADWRPGAACGDLDASLAKARSLVAQWLDHQGYWFAKTDVRIEKDAANGNANLVVEVKDLGPGLSISELTFEGLTRHSERQVIDYLNLPQPLVYSESLRRRIVETLEESGRFHSIDVRPEVPFGPGQSVSIFVRVVEFEELPPLNQSLSQEQKAVVKLTHWINHWNETDDDLVIHATCYPGSLADQTSNSLYGFTRFCGQLICGNMSPQDVNLELTLCPSGGALLQLQSQARDRKMQPRRTVLTSQQISGLQFEDTKRSFRMESFAGGIAAGLTLHSLRKGSKFDAIYNLGFSLDPGRRPEFAFEFRFPAASVLSEIEHIQPAPHDDRIMQARFYSYSATVDFERESGRILKLCFGDEDMTVVVETQPGALNRKIPEVERLFATGSLTDESNAMTELGRMLILQYAAELKRSGHSDDAGLISGLLEGPAVEQLVNDLAASNPPGRFNIPAPGNAASAPQDNLLSQATTAFSNAGQFAINRRVAIHDLKSRETLSDLEVIELISTTVGEAPELDAISRFMISYLRSLTPDESERLASIVENGEIMGIGAGMNLRPLFLTIQVASGDDPKLIRKQAIAVTWQTFLSARVRHWVASDGAGGSQWRWEFKTLNEGKRQLPPVDVIRSASSQRTERLLDGDDLNSIIGEAVQESNLGFKLALPEGLNGPGQATQEK